MPGLITLALIAVGGLALLWWRGTTVAQPIAPATLPAWLAAHPDALVIDVRTPGEYRAGHIAGARSRPLGTWLPTRRAGPPDRPLLLICQHGPRSRLAAGMLAWAGFRQIYELQGGMSDWKGPLVADDPG